MKYLLFDKSEKEITMFCRSFLPEVQELYYDNNEISETIFSEATNFIVFSTLYAKEYFAEENRTILKVMRFMNYFFEKGKNVAFEKKIGIRKQKN